MPTASTIPLILLLVFLWRATRGQILPAVLFVSVFSGASALDLGTFGLPCWLFTLGVFLVVRLLNGHQTYRITTGTNRLALHATIAFVGYVVLTSLAWPLLFRGIVIARRLGMQPIGWDISNVAQLFYILAVAIIYFIAVSSSRDELMSALDWYVRGCVTAGIVAMYQLLNATLHIPYPEIVLYSNKEHVIYRAYKISGMWRLNGPFNEASEMSSFMLVGMALLGWKMLTQPFKARYLFCFALLFACMLMTQSSTGYFTLAIELFIGGALYIRYLFRGGGISHGYVILAAVLFISLAGAFAISHGITNAIQTSVNSTLIDKKNSQSYKERGDSDVNALDTLAKTYYMGAGFGSARASGLIYNMLANLGVPGVILFLILVGSLFAPLFRRAPIGSLSSPYDPYARALFAMSMLLAAMLVSGSEIGDPMLWVLFGVTTVGPRPTPQFLAQHTPSRSRAGTFNPRPLLSNY